MCIHVPHASYRSTRTPSSDFRSKQIRLLPTGLGLLHVLLDKVDQPAEVNRTISQACGSSVFFFCSSVILLAGFYVCSRCAKQFSLDLEQTISSIWKQISGIMRPKTFLNSAHVLNILVYYCP